MKSLLALTFFGSVALICAQSAHAGLLADEEEASASTTSENIISDDFDAPHSRFRHAHGALVKGLHQRQQERERATRQAHTRSGSGNHSALLERPSRTRDCTTSRRHPCPAPPDGVPASDTTLSGNLVFNAPPTGNLGESDAAGDSYNSLVTARHHRILPVTPVPEPGSLLLLAIGATAFAIARRRNRPN
jgi:hypothetical protein